MDPFFEEAPSQGGFDLKNIWRSFWCRKWLFFIPFVLCLAMALVAIRVMTPIYLSRGQVQIKSGGTDSRLINDEIPGSRRGRSSQSNVRADIEILITSPEFLEKVIRGLDLHERVQARYRDEGQPEPDVARAIAIADNQLQRLIRVRIDGKDLYSIGVEHPDPQLAYDITRYILDLFLIEYRAQRLSVRTSARNFLENQRDRYRQELADAEMELNNFLGSRASDSLGENPVNAYNLSTVAGQLNLLRERHFGQDAQELGVAEERVRSVLGHLPDAAVFGQDAVVGGYLREAEELGVDILALSAGTGPAVEMQTRLGQLRVRLSSRIEGDVANQYPNLQLMDQYRIRDYLFLRLSRNVETKVINRMDRAVAEFREFTAQQPVQASKVSELQSEVARAREFLLTIEQEITQQQVNLEAGLADVGFQVWVRRQPSLPIFPIEPDKLRLTFMAIALSLCLGTGLVMLAIFLDRSFRSVPEIEKVLGLPVIGTLPVIQDDHFARRHKLRILRWFVIVLGILMVAAVGFFIVYPRLG